jgi:uncharacterized protein YoxC
MSIGELFLAATGLAIIVITIFLVPVLIQLRKVAERAENLLATLNQEVPPLLKNLNDSAAELRLLSSSLNRKVEEVEQILNLARSASDNFMHTSDLFKNTLLPIITKVSSFGAGLYAFIRFLRKSRQDNN